MKPDRLGGQEEAGLAGLQEEIASNSERTQDEHRQRAICRNCDASSLWAGGGNRACGISIDGHPIRELRKSWSCGLSCEYIHVVPTEINK